MSHTRKPAGKALEKPKEAPTLKSHQLPVVLENGKTEDRAMAEIAVGHAAPPRCWYGSLGMGRSETLRLRTPRMSSRRPLLGHLAATWET